MKTENLGWVVAAALAGAMVASGFQDNKTKIGTVDIKKVFDQSEYAKQQTEVLQNLGSSREAVLQFVNRYKFMKVEDARRFKELSLKPNPSASDKDAVEKIKAAVVAEDAQFRALQTKSSPTADDQKKLGEYSQRIQAMGALQAQWAQEFETEIGTKQASLREEALSRVKQSISGIAAKEGYNIVFVTDIAPFSTNDITDESLKAMNTKK
jgi:Skp family chaperone for outer membrane proteins